MLESGNRERLLAIPEVLAKILGCAEASDKGGEGGVGTPEVSDTFDFVGGVETAVDGPVVRDASEVGERGNAGRADSGKGRARAETRCCSMVDSASRSFSVEISDSILRSESSSRKRCVSTRSPSLSCSPERISSSSMTPLSMETLSFDSRSSKEEVVLRA